MATAVRDAEAGHSRLILLVGTSSTGKTRACWDAIQPLAPQGWRLWHPFHPNRAQAALEQLHQVQPRTVVWLNEAQHYLGDHTVGEQIAATLHHLLLTPERGPLLVLGTLWPEYQTQYNALPTPGTPDPHSRVRELLTGRTLAVPDTFDAAAISAAARLAEQGDRLLAVTLTRARTHGRLTQDLAGAPELLNRYRYASPAAKAILNAAMDARRLGVGLHLPQAFLTEAATDYLSQSDYDQLTDDWAEHAYAQLAKPVHGKQAPLRRTSQRPTRRPPATETAPPPLDPQFRLADYLEQHGRDNRRHLCPPGSFWYAAHAHLSRHEDIHELTKAAARRHRLEWAHHLRHRAADLGSATAISELAEMKAKDKGWVVAEVLLLRAAVLGNTSNLHWLALWREERGDRAGAEAAAQVGADQGDAYALYHVAMRRKQAGDLASAELLLHQTAELDEGVSLSALANIREEAGDRKGAEDLAEEAVKHGYAYGLGSRVGSGPAGGSGGGRGTGSSSRHPWKYRCPVRAGG
ncbi:hypothetical protein [Streptomyces drozdowiczii]|uniref:hypothetical protein n=1 Tax=Streptomyces drozdowiczii TaxID=202862 RepID=UPI00403C943D